MNKTITHYLRFAGIASVILLFCVGCTTFPDKVARAQSEIEASFQQLGYSPSDVALFETFPRERQGNLWYMRHIVFQDRGNKSWPDLRQFFAHEANYSFDFDLAVGESESDIQKVRWFEFKLDTHYTVYRVEFHRRILPRMEMDLRD